MQEKEKKENQEPAVEAENRENQGDQKQAGGGGESAHLKTAEGKATDGPSAEEKTTQEEAREKLTAEIAELKDKYLRQAAEFDNYRKRTAREFVEMNKVAGKEVIIPLLEVIDDCERAQVQMNRTEEAGVIKEGSILIFNKLKTILQTQGLKEMVSIGQDFDPDMHEAVAEIPAPDPSQVGKVIDEVQKGYYLNDKIIRFAKVVVGK